MKKLIVEVKEVYGNKAIYPICEDAKAFARIAGTKTLTSQAITDIKNLGYEISVQQQEI